MSLLPGVLQFEKIVLEGLKAARNIQKYEKICEKKRSTSGEVLCQGYCNEWVESLG